jgi:hypothetical protein
MIDSVILYATCNKEHKNAQDYILSNWMSNLPSERWPNPNISWTKPNSFYYTWIFFWETQHNLTLRAGRTNWTYKLITKNVHP